MIYWPTCNSLTLFLSHAQHNGKITVVWCCRLPTLLLFLWWNTLHVFSWVTSKSLWIWFIFCF